MLDTDVIPAGLISSLRGARHITVLTGSGISAESGVPTFRDVQSGLWSQYNPHQLATRAAFQSNPKLVWEWYAWRRSLVTKALPSSGHLALVNMESNLMQSGGVFTLITQNVDGLHQRAGSRSVIELHGNIMRTKCFKENIPIISTPDSKHVPPHCPDCGGLLRPDVVWFGESLPIEELELAQQAALSCDIIFSIGTSAVVQPAASLPLRALRAGAILVEINPVETPLTPNATYFIQDNSGRLLPLLVDAVWPGNTPSI